MQHTLSFFAMILHKDFSAFCNESLKKMDLSKGLLYFILYIGKHPHCSPVYLSQNLNFDSGHTTGSIDKLVKTGFVLRERNDHDKRAYILQLTEKGQQAFEASYCLFPQWDEKIFENISMEDRLQLISLLDKLVQIRSLEMKVAAFTKLSFTVNDLKKSS